MIIVKLTGGLGNQMFQYALGRALAEKWHTELKLDTSWYRLVEDRAYELYHFQISAPIANASEIRNVKGSLLKQLINPLWPLQKRTIIEKGAFNFDPRILGAGPNVFLDGSLQSWQSEMYFKDIAHILRQEFILSEPMDRANQKMADNIRAAKDPVSLHVRRGDYVTKLSTNKYHGTCSIEYYEAAIAKLVMTVKQPIFFIFSDDSEWVRDNLKLDYQHVYVNHNMPSSGYEDMRLMSLCHNHIIANSSFSWWGAWLGSYAQKQVIAPKKWFNTLENDTKDLIPETWQRV